MSNQQSSKNTYLSNDAGKTWYWFANGTYEYEIANYGGLIMMAKNSEATKTVFWTEDEGRVWSECALDENFANTNEVCHVVLYKGRVNQIHLWLIYS